MKSKSFIRAVQPQRKKISLKIAIILTLFVFYIAFFILGALAVKRQDEIGYAAKINSAKSTLLQLSKNAAAPLASDDTLLLNTLIKNTDIVNGSLYAIIVDNDNLVKAHTNPARLDSELNGQSIPPGEMATNGVTKTIFRDPEENTRILNLTAPVLFAQKKLGTVHVGVSLDHVNEALRSERFLTVRDFLLTGLIVTLLVIIGIVAVSRHFNLYYAANVPDEVVGGVGDCYDPSSDYAGLNLRLPTGADGFDNQMLRVIRDQVTVLSSGIRGFKSYTENRSPEDILKNLDEYIEIFRNIIEDYGGRLEGLVGDVVTAVFSDSVHNGGQSERAVRAAVAMQEAFEKTSGKNNELVKKVGIGISSGVVLSGTICSGRRRKVTYIGECFKIAYTLCIIAGSGNILITKDVYHSIEKLVTVEPVAPRIILDNVTAWENFRLHHIKGKT